MNILQGSGYELPLYLTDLKGKVITPDMVSEGAFSFGDLEKLYGEKYGEQSVVYFDPTTNHWIVPLSEEETFAMQNKVTWQVRFLFANGIPDGTVPKTENVYKSINKRRFTGGESNV